MSYAQKISGLDTLLWYINVNDGIYTGGILNLIMLIENYLFEYYCTI